MKTVGKLFCKLLDDITASVLDKKGRISEGQTGFRNNRGGVDDVHGRKNHPRSTEGGAVDVLLSLDVQKACDTIWRSELWKQLSKKWINGKCAEC